MILVSSFLIDDPVCMLNLDEQGKSRSIAITCIRSCDYNGELIRLNDLLTVPMFISYQ